MGQEYFLPLEEEWLRHQEDFSEAYLSAADGVVARTEMLLSATPRHEEGTTSSSLIRFRFLWRRCRTSSTIANRHGVMNKT